MKDPEEKEIMAYIAGTIDGDGSICLKVGPRGKVSPLVQLHNSVKHLPQYLNRLFGGTLAFDKPKKEGYKIVWKWMLQGEVGCEKFLSSILEYLVVKKDSAIAVLEFLRNPDVNKNYFEECKKLNLQRKIESVSWKDIERRDSDDSFFWAYIAGIMDTDGSFSIERAVRKPTSENRQKKNLIKYRPKIILTMVSKGSIRHILSNCKLGGMSVVKANTTLRGSAFRFSISARAEAIEFLKKCIPYLQIKAFQAIKLLSFCRGYIPTNGLAKVPEEEILYREECYKEIMRLNNTPS